MKKKTIVIVTAILLVDIIVVTFFVARVWSHNNPKPDRYSPYPQISMRETIYYTTSYKWHKIDGRNGYLFHTEDGKVYTILPDGTIRESNLPWDYIIEHNVVSHEW